MGKGNIVKKLDEIVECKLRNKLNFLFVSDPMHGNTFQSSKG